jgi:hypothetical protein
LFNTEFRFNSSPACEVVLVGVVAMVALIRIIISDNKNPVNLFTSDRLTS